MKEPGDKKQAGRKLTILLKPGMTPAQVVEEIKKQLPDGYQLSATASQGAKAGDLTVRLTKVIVPVPEVKLVRANDARQKVTVQANRVHIKGTSIDDGPAPSVVSLTIDGTRVHLNTECGNNAIDTASAIAQALPSKYRPHIIRTAHDEAELIIKRA